MLGREGSDRIGLCLGKAIADGAGRQFAAFQAAVGFLEVRDHIFTKQMVVMLFGGPIGPVVIEQQETAEAAIGLDLQGLDLLDRILISADYG